jgi:exodeoxyribonuclease V beta subunit
MSRFSAYRETWLRRGFGVMLRAWLESEAVALRLLARSDGERRLTNLLHLGELLQQARRRPSGAGRAAALADQPASRRRRR